MPVYEYSCKDCGNEFDKLRSMNDADTAIACSRCLSINTRRKLSLCFSQSEGRSVAGTQSGGCAGCSGGSCASCHH